VPPGGGTGKTLRSTETCCGAGGWRTWAREACLSRVAARRWRVGFDRPCVPTDPGFMNLGVGVRASQTWRGGWAPGGVRGTGRCPAACVDRVVPDPDRGGESSRGEEAQESTDPAISPWPGQEVVAERTPGGSKASKRACRPFTGEPSVDGTGRSPSHAHACRGGRPSDRGELHVPAHASRVRLRASSPGKGLARAVKAVAKLPATLRRRRSESEPARKHEARESEHGSPGRESSVGKFQGRERHGRRPRSVGASRRAASSARGSCVPRARPELSRGARTLRTAPAEVWHTSATSG